MHSQIVEMQVGFCSVRLPADVAPRLRGVCDVVDPGFWKQNYYYIKFIDLGKFILSNFTFSGGFTVLAVLG